ncbi:MAG: DUF5683 domain-containing protein [Bacteroidota bacterium]
MRHLNLLSFSALLLLLSLLNHNIGFTQTNDTIQPEQDTLAQNYQEHSPKKAAWMSTFLPGLGQIYNNKIWKVPIIYGAAGVIYYFYDMNASLYEEYSGAYTDFTNNEIDQYKGYDKAEELKSAKDYYRRNRDLNIILFGALYLANILDASVDAHLYNFDVSRELSLEIKPTQINNEFEQPIPAVSCSIYF